MIKRAVLTGLLITFMLTLFLGRLAWLQLLPGNVTSTAPVSGGRDSWKRMAVVQRQRTLILDTGRGDFLDRNGKAITGETYLSIAFFPIHPDARGEQGQLDVLAKRLTVSTEELLDRWDHIREPAFWRKEPKADPIRLTVEQADELNKLRVEGIRILPYHKRYISGFDAKHWIGFTSQHPEWLRQAYGKELLAGKRKLTEQVGGYGLEKSLDPLLRGIGETSVSFYIDGRNNPLHGLDLTLSQPNNPYYPLQVVTTVDLELQNRIEKYADLVGLKEGAIVVLDANNADVVAMVSRPKLNPGHFYAADGTEWGNLALKAVEPGSVYKLITAASALENKAVNLRERFHCDGKYGRYGLSCWKDGGHGILDMQEGIAQSCNIVFATLAERLMGSQLQRTAQALGVTEKVGWHSEKAFGPFPRALRLLEEEERGQLFLSDSKKVDGGILAQSGIGQRDVRMSPLQGANLIVTLLHGGEVKEPRIVSEIRYGNGQRMVALPTHQANTGAGRIKPSTARTLLNGMKAAVNHGTGQSIRDGLWQVAGKTGTAETIKEGKALNHQWFVGYGPVQSPRYAVAVLSAYRPIGSSHQALKLFRGVMDIAAEHSLQKPSISIDR